MFDRIYLEITNQCNLNCSFCSGTNRSPCWLTVEQFEIILTKIHKHTKQIVLHLMGEPLLHPDLVCFLSTVEKFNMPVQITTNGMLLNDEFLKLVISHKKIVRQINFSIQSFLANFPLENQVNVDKFKKYFNLILDFVDAININSPDTYINFRLWNFDQDDVTLNRNEPVILELEKRYNIAIKREMDFRSIKSKKLFNKVYLHFDSMFEWPQKNIHNNNSNKEKISGKCYALDSHIGILSDGSVVPCCLDANGEIVLGNIFQQSLEEILNCSRAKQMREGFKRQELVEDLCKNCTYINRFR